MEQGDDPNHNLALVVAWLRERYTDKPADQLLLVCNLAKLDPTFSDWLRGHPLGIAARPKPVLLANRRPLTLVERKKA